MKLSDLSREDQNSISEFLSLLTDEHSLTIKIFYLKTQFESVKRKVEKWKDNNKRLIEIIDEIQTTKIGNESI